MMREYWANVYDEVDEDGSAYSRVGNELEDRESAEAMADRMRATFTTPAFRIHVRVKPEGAPRRYASEANRRAWEMFPESAAAHARIGLRMCYEAGEGIWLSRLPERVPRVLNAWDVGNSYTWST